MKVIIIVFGILLLGMLLSCSEASLDQMIDIEPIEHVVTYQSDVERIMLEYCAGCHFGPTPRAGLSLFNYEEVRVSTESGTLVSRINDQFNPMPQLGLMPPLERRLIEKWIVDGYLEQ